MGHFIHAIVAPAETADAIAECWPELPRLDRGNGYAVFPVDAKLIDEKITPDKTPTVTGDEFMLLTDGFRRMLQSLSDGGQLAYVETEYFGGAGGQGALVYRDKEQILMPMFSESGMINKALRLIGIRRGLLADEFTVVGFAEVRNNDGLLSLIAAQSENAK